MPTTLLPLKPLPTRIKVLVKNEQTGKQALPDLIEYFYEYDDRPGIITYSMRNWH